MNSMKYRVSLLAQHWTYQTQDKYINAAFVILPIDLKIQRKLSLIKSSSCVIQRGVVLRRIFSPQENGMTFKLSTILIQSNSKLPLLANIRRI